MKMDWWLRRLPHTRRYFVILLQIFCRGQIGLEFFGPSACRALADFFSQLTALRLGAGSFKIKMAPIPLTWLSWHFLIGWAARKRRQIVLVHHTLADKARQAPILSRTCLNSPHTSRQVKSFCRPTKNRLVCGGPCWPARGNSPEYQPGYIIQCRFKLFSFTQCVYCSFALF